MRSHTARALIVVLLAVSSASCMTWSRKGPTPQEAIRSMNGVEQLRVTRSDGTRFVLAKPQIRGDSLMGLEASLITSMPLSKVFAVEARTFSLGRTARNVGAWYLVLSALGFLITAS